MLSDGDTQEVGNQNKQKSNKREKVREKKEEKKKNQPC